MNTSRGATALYPGSVFRTRDGKGRARKSDGVGWIRSGDRMTAAVIVGGRWVAHGFADRLAVSGK